ncbi:isoprenoid synthase domain-containing protein [Cercophora newfieldiana]|uniref:Terpene synthase n=1 Tax=Cercophora newfieldiana TaxID=92897 RepID=A0AA39Y0P0_9PEZI|nr:isoprenoid synthase domain-containing protein [Cercophora newfieldiana]
MATEIDISADSSLDEKAALNIDDPEPSHTADGELRDFPQIPAEPDLNEKAPFNTNDPKSAPTTNASPNNPPQPLAPTETCILIPDLFSSIMSSDVHLNPQYASVKLEADARVARIMKKDSKWAAKNAKVDLAFLASSWCHTCDEATLNLSMDWNHWVFLFDDQFDEGHLMTDVAAAREEIDKTLAVMKGSLRVSPTKLPVRYLMQTISDAPSRRSPRLISPPTEFQSHWIDMHQRYYSGLLQQVEDTRANRLRSYTVEEYMDLRVLTIGVYPAIALTEYAEGVTSLPERILQHPSLQECMRISAEMVVLVNDIASFKKDVTLNTYLNIINLARKGNQGLSAQQAMDEVGVMMDNCYQRWYRALATMPVWGEKIDREVLRFVGICRDVALGNLHWSFRTGRYLGGPQGVEVRKNRILTMLTQTESALTAADRECLDIAAIYI